MGSGVAGLAGTFELLEFGELSLQRLVDGDETARLRDGQNHTGSLCHQAGECA